MEEPEIHWTSSKYVLRDLTFPISICRAIKFGNIGEYMCAINCADTVFEVWIELFLSANFFRNWCIAARGIGHRNGTWWCQKVKHLVNNSGSSAASEEFVWEWGEVALLGYCVRAALKLLLKGSVRLSSPCKVEEDCKLFFSWDILCICKCCPGLKHLH